MNLVEAYKQLLKNIHHTLKEHGYSRRAGIFYKKMKIIGVLLVFKRVGAVVTSLELNLLLMSAFILKLWLSFWIQHVLNLGL